MARRPIKNYKHPELARPYIKYMLNKFYMDASENPIWLDNCWFQSSPKSFQFNGVNFYFIMKYKMKDNELVYSFYRTEPRRWYKLSPIIPNSEIEDAIVLMINERFFDEYAMVIIQEVLDC